MKTQIISDFDSEILKEYDFIIPILTQHQSVFINNIEYIVMDIILDTDKDTCMILVNNGLHEESTLI